MRLELVTCVAEAHEGDGPGGELLQARLPEDGQALCARYAGQVQTLYLDPPFFSKQWYALKLGVGEAGWRSGKPQMTLTAYDDRWESEEAYLAMMRDTLDIAHSLLRPEGALFLHIDARMHAKLRLMLDKRFGEENFVNELVWVYESGGRAKRHFSRKHDTILFYRKSAALFFDIEAVAVARQTRSNHMKRAVDEDGRSYRSIRSGGKEYRYYDDAPAYPSDVWDDISHLQQKDPQRTGFDSQKPLALLQRVICCSSRPSDLVADLFVGSGTTAVAAAELGRPFLGVDASPISLITARKRLLGRSMRFACETSEGAPALELRTSQANGALEFILAGYVMEPGLCPHPPDHLAQVDQWSVGFLREGVFHACAHTARSKASPKLAERLTMPLREGTPAVLTVDVLGRRMIHRIDV